MTKIAIVVDSSVGLTLEEQQLTTDVFVAPLSIIYDNKEYVDQIELTVEAVQEILSRNELIKTSQPSVGVVHALYEKIQNEGYTDIIVLSLSSKLSGTFNSFSAAAEALDNNNVRIVDTWTLAGPIQEGILLTKKLIELNTPIDDIIDTLNSFYTRTESYVLPENLDQLKASGRISNAAAAVASLLKMKVLLKLDNHGDTIEKFATARTDGKLLNTMFEDIKNSCFNPDKDKFFVLHSLNEEKALKIKQDLLDLYPQTEVSMSFLPAAISGHAGNGTIALQWFQNHKNV